MNVHHHQPPPRPVNPHPDPMIDPLNQVPGQIEIFFLLLELVIEIFFLMLNSMIIVFLLAILAFLLWKIHRLHPV